jgi:hypothetical protein
LLARLVGDQACFQSGTINNVARIVNVISDQNYFLAKFSRMIFFKAFIINDLISNLVLSAS